MRISRMGIIIIIVRTAYVMWRLNSQINAVFFFFLEFYKLIPN